MALAVEQSSSSMAVKTWRTAFLTLRDETLGSPLPGPTLLHLLQQLILSQSDALIAAARHLPSHEVSSDVVFLMELVNGICDSIGVHDLTPSLVQLSHLIYYISNAATLNLNSTSWPLVLGSFHRIVKILLNKDKGKSVLVRNASVVGAIKLCLETLRSLFGVCLGTSLLTDYKQLFNFLLMVVDLSQVEPIYAKSCIRNEGSSTCNSLCEIQTVALMMIDEVHSRVGSSLPIDIWQSAMEVIRKVMDILSSNGTLVEDSVMAGFYTSLLHCLHLFLVEPKGSLSDHVPGLVAALKMFFSYGLSNKPHTLYPTASEKRNYGPPKINLNVAESSKSNGRYKPPHLRKKDVTHQQLTKEDHTGALQHVPSPAYHTSSDSDYSDSEGAEKDTSRGCFAKTRLAAIICIQDLCRADPKLLSAQWTMLLPSSDVLQPRMYEATLLSCLLFDPYVKARIASASAIMGMLDGPASVFLQVAEFKGSSKCGSFTALSSSLGQILFQLHSGTLYLVKHETDSMLLTSSLKVLMLLISSTPYSRLPGELLLTVISSLHARIEEGFPSRSDSTSLVAAAINCLSLAHSVSPSSAQVKDRLVEELSTGFAGTQRKRGVLSMLFNFCKPETSPSISFEALQALKALAHNYPDVMNLCWEQVSSIVYGFLCSSTNSPRSWRGNAGKAAGATGEKVIAAAIKVLDECLRAISGFKGTEDLSSDKLLDSPFTSDYVKVKTISSAPLYGSESPAPTMDEVETPPSGNVQWSEAIVRHMPLVLHHPSAVVRAASVTCFAGITSSVFFSLAKDKRNFVIASSIDAAVSDEVPSVRAAACRAIGVIACFPLIFQSADILEKFINAAEHNTHDSLVSVRITASWAIANICDSLGHDANASPQMTSLLINSNLRLAKDNDKVKANAVRALGNLSRFMQFDCQLRTQDGHSGCSYPASNGANHFSVIENHGAKSNDFRLSLTEGSYWLDNMVQTFLSCVTTGNVKVQWNVCHALSNLFFNKTLKLQDMDWAPSVFSVLLLLLRDSSNFKIRIQAAAALAVPETVEDYGKSFSDVVRGVELILENLKSDRISAPSNFKYRDALQKQLTSTMLHVLALASRSEDTPIKEFLVKKASFLEEWLRVLCMSLEETTHQSEAEDNSPLGRKRDLIMGAIHSLVDIYEGSNHQTVARRLNKMVSSAV